MRFSVIIPTYNRAKLLDRCLAAIGKLNYPRTEFEVLVVDDASEPPAMSIVAQHADNLPVRYSRRDIRQGPAGARNHGLREANGDYVLFTDDDCAPEPEWLNAFDRAFTQHPAACLGGAIVCAPDIGIFGVASQSLITFLYHHAGRTEGDMRFFCSNNFAFPRDKLLQMGGFDETFPLPAAEDREICARWLRHGNLFFVPEGIIRHSQELSLASFWRQHFRYGRGAFQFWLRQRDAGASGNRLQSWRFYGAMLAFPFRDEPPPRALTVSLLLAICQVACAAGYFAERRAISRHHALISR